MVNRREEYKADVPMGVLLLTAGVDIQDDRIEAEVVGWGENEESWGIDFKIFRGSPARPRVWKDLDEYLMRKWQHESGATMTVQSTCIDTGGHYTAEAYKFIKKREVRRIYGVKGSPKPGKPLVGRPSVSNFARISLFPIGTDSAEDMLYGRMQIEEFGPGYMHFPNLECYDEEFFRQLTSEKPITKYSKGLPTGIRQWIKTRARNEALDMRVYSLAAMVILNPNFKMIAKNFEKKIRKEEEERKKVEDVSREGAEEGGGVEVKGEEREGEGKEEAEAMPEPGRRKTRSVGRWIRSERSGGWIGGWR